MSRTKRHKDDSGRWCGENTTGRDKKPKNKPAGWFKRMRRRIRRAKEKMAMREDREIPIFKKNDVCDWN